MRRDERIREVAFGSLVMLALAVLITRPFAHTRARAVAYGIPLFAIMAAFGFWDRRRARRKLEAHCGRITVRGPVLIIQKPAYDGGSFSVHASTMRQLWYEYSAYGWSGANSWGLLYEIDGQRRTFGIHEGDDQLIVEPLRAWCMRHLPGFDPATFDRLRGSLGHHEEPGVLLWARQDA